MNESLLHATIFLVGLLLVFIGLSSALRTFVLARRARDLVSTSVFVLVRRILSIPLKFARSSGSRDSILGLHAPISLFVLLPVWLAIVLVGYMAMFWSTGIDDWVEAFTISGSSLLTLGFARGNSLFHTFLAFTEAAIGLMLVAILIAYLPTMYASFSRRELAVTQLEVRAGTPPSAIEFLERMNRLGRLDRLGEFWREWESWFADLEETHTSLVALVFFRSPRSDLSWLTAAGAVLDAAALTASTLDIERDPSADLSIRAGYLALRNIADLFGIQYNPNPSFPTDLISISREEFQEAYLRLADQGVPLKRDMEQAWLNFAGWRVNYDKPLLGLARIVQAPYAPWSSDRMNASIDAFSVSKK